MCLALIALDAHPRHAVVLAANRDEFHGRDAAPAAWWREAAILAGRDLRGGGTWLGVDRRGRFAFVTNVREPARNDPAAPTRGALVPQVLGDLRPVFDAVAAAVAAGNGMNGFNLLAGDVGQAAWGSNRAAVAALAPGVHGVSNAALDTPWPKVVRTRDAMRHWLARGGANVEELFAILADRTPARDAELPHTGVPPDRERMLSAPFIVSPEYGTRCTTVVLLDRSGDARFVERRFAADGAPCGEVDVRFAIDAARPVSAAGA